MVKDLYTPEQVRRVLNGAGIDMEQTILFFAHTTIIIELPLEKYQKIMEHFFVLDVRQQKVLLSL
jgi:hypothetical protein